ncbi:hypothetical protein PROFUN_06577 [Planoprotostelium fungivorum]|uniref:LisH domain-containing protein n=1 Tax=Planoprotostelium fungivorum TaxID=1890364 RepID=A0A2P6MRW2_9EUKA|nr:hypothetical protein PROFUN_06577 [Planoprotostelium fungivorum]
MDQTGSNMMPVDVQGHHQPPRSKDHDDVLLDIMQTLRDFGYIRAVHEIEMQSRLYFDLQYWDELYDRSNWKDLYRYSKSFLDWSSGTTQRFILFDLIKIHFFHCIYTRDIETACELVVSELTSLDEPIRNKFVSLLQDSSGSQEMRDYIMFTGSCEAKKARKEQLLEKLKECFGDARHLNGYDGRKGNEITKTARETEWRGKYERVCRANELLKEKIEQMIHQESTILAALKKLEALEEIHSQIDDEIEEFRVGEKRPAARTFETIKSSRSSFESTPVHSRGRRSHQKTSSSASSPLERETKSRRNVKKGEVARKEEEGGSVVEIVDMPLETELSVDELERREEEKREEKEKKKVGEERRAEERKEEERKEEERKEEERKEEERKEEERREQERIEEQKREDRKEAERKEQETIEEERREKERREEERREEELRWEDELREEERREKEERREEQRWEEEMREEERREEERREEERREEEEQRWQEEMWKEETREEERRERLRKEEERREELRIQEKRREQERREVERRAEERREEERREEQRREQLRRVEQRIERERREGEKIDGEMREAERREEEKREEEWIEEERREEQRREQERREEERREEERRQVERRQVERGQEELRREEETREAEMIEEGRKTSHTEAQIQVKEKVTDELQHQETMQDEEVSLIPPSGEKNGNSSTTTSQIDSAGSLG